MTTGTPWAEAGPVPQAGSKAVDLRKPAPSLFVKARPLATPEDVRNALQLASELELATLPAYLQAVYSLDERKNGMIVGMITGVAMQEMAHFCTACNILVAIGGNPAIDDPKFIPTYPGGLPKDIGTQPGQPEFIVHLLPFSTQQVRDCFMIIEEPANPIDIRDSARASLMSADIADNYRTIGEFYEAISAALSADDFKEPRVNRQVTGILDVPVIRTLADARAAIDRIIREGEGTPSTPQESDGTMAHYYTFYEIFKGRKIVKKDDGWYFGDDLVPFDPTGVQDIIADPKQALYPEGSNAAIRSQAFNTYFSNLLKALHQSFNGQPDRINDSIGLMFDLKVQAKQLMLTPMPGQPGKFAAPTWEYVS